MPKALLGSIALIAILAVSPSNAEMADQLLGNFVKRAYGCGIAFQSIRTLEIEDRYPNFEQRTMDYARAWGASDWELEVLEASFQLGITSAMDQGVAPGPDITEQDQEYAIKGFDKKIYKCWGRAPDVDDQ